MSAPRIEIDLGLVERNTRILVDRLAARDVRVLGVTKATLGSPGIAAAMLRGGAVGLGDSRVENLARLTDLDVSVPRTLIRSPMVSQAGRVVRTATASLNTEPVVLAALDDAATRAGTRHDVILMVELGDLREGIAVDDVASAVETVLTSRSLRLLGLGTNLACQNGVVPDDTNMGVLHRLVDQTEAHHHIALGVVSSGNSANLDWALTTRHLGRTNELRLGEAILLGTEPLGRTQVAGLSTGAFTLVGEVIEVADKPARPWGSQAQAAYGAPPPRTAPGTRRQAIVALGRQDVDIDGLTPPAGITVLGMSSDHLVLDVGERPVAVGDEIRFALGYGALVRAMTSPFVTKVESPSSPSGVHRASRPRCPSQGGTRPDHVSDEPTLHRRGGVVHLHARPGACQDAPVTSTRTSSGPERRGEPTGRTAATTNVREGPPARHGTTTLLAFGALGVVFGDIGTSPLYALQTVFSIDHNSVLPTPGDVYGVISMVFWAITVIVSVKYVALVMRADNDGEGGILALVALLREKLGDRRRLAVAMVLGMFGAALFYGDSVITPAISVMSAFEGVVVADASFQRLVLPASVAVLTVLFVVQRRGTEVVGRAFGPVMALWFVVLAVLGVPHIAENPAILRALSPTYAVAFVVEHPVTAFIAMGAVVLTITGAEALYADMGHFGAAPIRMGWYAVVFPALTLNYLGQGAMILDDPATIDNPFFHLAPSWATLPLVALAALATVIASQAVISGAFSVSRQAVRLGLFPRLSVRQTSRHSGGQIYVPAINWILFLGVLVLITVFRSSSRLATAYGLAVTGTLLLTSLLFLLLAKRVWNWATWKVVAYGVVVIGLELVFFAANVTKILSGGWLPLLIAAIVVTIMTTWRAGAERLVERRSELEGPLEDFVRMIQDTGVPRVPGLAVFPHPNKQTTPLALRSHVAFNRVLHEHVVIVQIINENVPHIRHVDRVVVDDLGYADDGIVHVCVRVGFNDSQDIPKGLALAIGQSHELTLDVDEAHYFLSVLDVHVTGAHHRRSWRPRLFVWLSRNAASRAEAFHLPPERTVIMGAHLNL